MTITLNDMMTIKRIGLTASGANCLVVDMSRGFKRSIKAFLYNSGDVKFDGSLLVTLTPSQIAELDAADVAELATIDFTAPTATYNSRGEQVSADRAEWEC